MIMKYNNYALENWKKLYGKYEHYREVLEKVNNWNYKSNINFLRFIPKIKMTFINYFQIMNS